MIGVYIGIGVVAALCALEALGRWVDKRRPNMYARKQERRVIDNIGEKS